MINLFTMLSQSNHFVQQNLDTIEYRINQDQQISTDIVFKHPFRELASHYPEIKFQTSYQKLQNAILHYFSLPLNVEIIDKAGRVQNDFARCYGKRYTFNAFLFQQVFEVTNYEVLFNTISTRAYIFRFLPGPFSRGFTFKFC